jgi:FkbM family methyltransferase
LAVDKNYMLKGILQIIKTLFQILVNDPKFFFKQVFLELKSFLIPLPKSPVFKKINGISFEFDFNYDPHIKRFYFGTYEARIVRILKNFLNKGDTFIDVGANIGYLTAIAAGCVGREGEVHSFEPVPEYFRKLRKLAKMNNQFKIVVNQFALGDVEGKVKIYVPEGNIGNSTIIPDLISKTKLKKIIKVPIHRLDEYIREKKLNNIKLIKIDVEGFEFPVLKGLEKYFSESRNTGTCPLILCEIHPSVYPSLGYRLQDLFDYMERFFYYPFEITNLKRRMNINEIGKTTLINVAFKLCK